MSRPHFYPKDRFFVVVSSAWWLGIEKFDPENTIPRAAEGTSSITQTIICTRTAPMLEGTTAAPT